MHPRLQLAQVMADSKGHSLSKPELDSLLKGAATDVLKSASASLAEQCREVLKPKLNQQQLKLLQDPVVFILLLLFLL